MGMKEAAASYCQVIERAAELSREEFVRQVALTLVAAMSAAYQLPDAEFEGPSHENVADITNDQWNERRDEVRQVLGDWENFWTTFSSYDLDDKSRMPIVARYDGHEVNLSLSDALADIWRDLKEGLNELDKGVPLDEVTFEWRLLFGIHWGTHAADALRAIHAQWYELER